MLETKGHQSGRLLYSHLSLHSNLGKDEEKEEEEEEKEEEKEEVVWEGTIEGEQGREVTLEPINCHPREQVGEPPVWVALPARPAASHSSSHSFLGAHSVRDIRQRSLVIIYFPRFLFLSFLYERVMNISQKAGQARRRQP